MKQRNLILGAAVVVVCAAIAAVSLGGSTNAAVPFSELPKRQDRVQVYGSLDHGSIRPIRGHNVVEFRLIDDRTGEQVTVIYENQSVALPANFPAASHARAIGVYDRAAGRFVADQVITKCPSKYDQKLEMSPEQKQALAAWERRAGEAATPAGAAPAQAQP